MEKPSLLLIIPAHNEADIIEIAVRRVWSVLARLQGMECHLTVVDNASTDGTGDKVMVPGLPSVDVLSTPTKGKGAAILHAARIGQDTDFFGFIDADLSADPENITNLLRPLLEGKSDIAVGSRLLNKQAVKRSFLRTLSSECFNLMRRVIINTPVRDSQCGLKIMNRRGREIVRTCEETGWFLDMEFLARAGRQGLSIVELPITWDECPFSGRKSKLNFVRDGVGALLAMLRIRKRLHQ